MLAYISYKIQKANGFKPIIVIYNFGSIWPGGVKIEIFL